MLALVLVFYFTPTREPVSNAGRNTEKAIDLMNCEKGTGGAITDQRELSAPALVGKHRVILVCAFTRSQERGMSRAPLVLSALAIFCASSFLALADEKGAIASAVERGRSAAIEKLTAKQRQHDYRPHRHYHGYDEAPSIGA
jgi:hypothetical protein